MIGVPEYLLRFFKTDPALRILSESGALLFVKLEAHETDSITELRMSLAKFLAKASLDVFHHPNITSLRSEAIEKDPVPVRRPDRIVDAHIRILKFKNPLGLP